MSHQTDIARSVAASRLRAAHGTRNKYQGGCRCIRCKAANASYVKQRLDARNAGMSNELVPAEKARQHLFYLSKHSVGAGSVSDVTGISFRTLMKIRAGERANVRRQTEQQILAVTKAAVAGGALVSAKKTWHRINLMLKEGFTKAEIARRLGYKGKNLNLSKTRVTANTAARIERLYTLTMQI